VRLSMLLRPLPRRLVRRALPAVAWLVLLVAPAMAAPGHVVPPGQEDLVAGMLGRGELLDGCRLIEVDMQPEAVVGTYRCEGSGDPIAVVLGHPSSGHGAAFTTAKFAVSVRGPAPTGLLDALRSRITEREAAWPWLETGGAGRSPSADVQAEGGGRIWLPPAASGVAMLLVVAAGLVRARRVATRKPRFEA
jgi:hypothetical protein